MMDERELEKRLDALVEESIDETSFQELRQELLRSPEARRRYYDMLAVDHLLAERYEMPDYVSMHARAMDDSWVVQRFRLRKLSLSLGGAAAVILLTLATFFAIRGSWDGVEFEGSLDSRYSVSGGGGETRAIKPRETLEVERGVVSIPLNPYVEAWIEGPASARLIDRSGNLELLEGRAYFEIAPGGKDFEVHCDGTLIRDIGTKFGVDHQPGKQLEVHVGDGAVEITSPQGTRHRVDSHEAVRHTPGAGFTPIPFESSSFIRVLPWQRVVFHDDFEGTEGARLSGREPRTGGNWLVYGDESPPLLRDGRFDTSHSYRRISATVNSVTEAGDRRRTYLMTFRTVQPANVGDKAGVEDAVERLELITTDGRPALSLVGTGSDQHQWRIEDRQNGLLSETSGVSALDAHTLTLLYEATTGIATLYEGSSPLGRQLASERIAPNLEIGGLAITNQNHGDVALEDITLSIVVYPQEAAAEE